MKPSMPTINEQNSVSDLISARSKKNMSEYSAFTNEVQVDKAVSELRIYKGSGLGSSRITEETKPALWSLRHYTNTEHSPMRESESRTEVSHTEHIGSDYTDTTESQYYRFLNISDENKLTHKKPTDKKKKINVRSSVTKSYKRL